MYVRGQCWIVVDRKMTDRPRSIDVLWHWHPDCNVALQKKNLVGTKNERGNLAVLPVGKHRGDVKLIKGQELPEIQGWYSEEYNKFGPNVASIYSARIKSDAVFVWVLQPFESDMPS